MRAEGGSDGQGMCVPPMPDVRKLRVGIPMGAVVQGVPRQQEHLRPGRQLLQQRVPVFEAAHVPLNYPVDDLTCQIAV